MTRRAVIVLAVASVLLTLTLAWIDYETHSLADLFAPQNLPALFLYSAAFFAVFSGAGIVGRKLVWPAVRAPSDGFRAGGGVS